MRDAVRGPKTAIPADRWAFGRCPAGRESLAASTSDICLFDGFQPDKLYELIYPAKNPIVMGLGHATTRDVASFLRYDTRDEAGNPNPLATDGGAGIRRIYATGASQTGAYLRDFMYYGFNEDESHRKVFDGIMPTIAGTLRVFINARFADPNVFGSQDVTRDFLQSSYPPFTYAVYAGSVHRHPRRHPEASGDRSAGDPVRLGDRVLAASRLAQRRRRRRAPGADPAATSGCTFSRARGTASPRAGCSRRRLAHAAL